MCILGLETFDAGGLIFDKSAWSTTSRSKVNVAPTIATASAHAPEAPIAAITTTSPELSQLAEVFNRRRQRSRTSTGSAQSTTPTVRIVNAEHEEVAVTGGKYYSF